MKYGYILLFLLIAWGCNDHQKKTTQSESSETQNSQGTILFIVSNQDTYGDSEINAANHFAEIVFAYDIFKKAGYTIDFVSPEGGAIPLGYLNTSNLLEKQYLYNFEFMSLLKATRKPREINPSDYRAVYYGGGGAAMFGVPENEIIQQITMKIYETNGIVSAICHGTAGLVNLKTSDGKFLYEGKKVNGFPDLFENMEAEYYKQFPFSIQQTITERSGIFEYSEEGWDNFHVIDDRLITGQDPTAAASVAQKVVEALSAQ